MIRTKQNWLGGRGYSPIDAEFISPPPEYVPELLEDLCAFIDRDDLPVTLQAAAAHAQFETIHPFMDGNGRVGRCLIHLIYHRRGLAASVVPPVSLVLATDADEYIKGLEVWRSDEQMEWPLFFAGCVLRSVLEARHLAEMIAGLQARWLAVAGTPRGGPTARKLIELLPGHPIVSVKQVEAMTGSSYVACNNAIQRLEASGVLVPSHDRARDRQWEAQDVFALLDAFERHLATPDGAATPVRAAPLRHRDYVDAALA